MSSENVYAQAYDDFTAALDPTLRDAVTKLMLHTRTRPDDPNMVGICLTAVATEVNTAAQARVLEAQQATMQTLEAMKTDPQLAQGLQRIVTFQRCLEAFRKHERLALYAAAIAAAVIVVFWGYTLILTWYKAYDTGRGDVTHRAVCNDLSHYIAGVSTYWRKLGYPKAADMLGGTYYADCR